mmetsp:Transcript_21944/g.45805  ORF Transcript_21944/g.45805 Transcript_21944/m.45805 type:complete len:209 (-) Transcript_21944:307-933(-)
MLSAMTQQEMARLTPSTTTATASSTRGSATHSPWPRPSLPWPRPSLSKLSLSKLTPCMPLHLRHPTTSLPLPTPPLPTLVVVAVAWRASRSPTRAGAGRLQFTTPPRAPPCPPLFLNKEGTVAPATCSSRRTFNNPNTRSSLNSTCSSPAISSRKLRSTLNPSKRKFLSTRSHRPPTPRLRAVGSLPCSTSGRRTRRSSTRTPTPSQM